MKARENWFNEQEIKLEKDKGNKKKPLKISSSGRLQIRKNLGPSGEKARTSGNKKTIQINKDYLSISNRMSKKKNKTESIKKLKSKSLVSPKKMKREFIKKVKNFQQQRQKNISEKINADSADSADSAEFENEFNKSLGFLQNIIDVIHSLI